MVRLPVAWVFVLCNCMFGLCMGIYENNRQHGDVNVDARLEDLLFAVLGEYTDTEDQSDYNYDYSDLTVKPEDEEETTLSSVLASTSSKPVLVTKEPASAPSEANSTHTSVNSPGPQLPLNTENMQIPVVVVTDPTRRKGYISSSLIRRRPGEGPPIDLESIPKRTCSPGFVLDDKNRCKRVKKPFHQKNRPLPYGLRYAKRPQHESEPA